MTGRWLSRDYCPLCQAQLTEKRYGNGWVERVCSTHGVMFSYHSAKEA